MDQRFEVGELVSLRADPHRQGSVIAALPGAEGSLRYRVFHSAGDIREYDEEQLVRVEVPATDPLSQLEAGEWLDASAFRASLTAARLSHPLVDNLYALHAARIQYIPFQFKPLLRFLRADRPRLLIADEVGVGKTIEAGLILRELETRRDVGNVLVVCPKALVPKWRAEMRRFDETFFPLTAEGLRYCLRETHHDGEWPRQYSRCIVHLELLRQEDNLFGRDEPHRRPGLLSLDSPPYFDMVIIDEAHHVRNPETNSWQLARFLCDVSDAVVLLTATPIHLGSRNLFTLLNLLRPDLFPDEGVFNEIIEPNRHLNQAIRHIRAREPEGDWQSHALRSLEEASDTSWGRQVLQRDPRFESCQRQLREPELPGPERVRCLRDLEEAHPLAHVMNRTRRRDIGRFTVRDPSTVICPFTEEQEPFYRELIDFRRGVLLLDYSPIVVRLITDTLERQASSCLPALVPLLRTFLRTGRFTAAEVSDDVDVAPEDLDLPAPLLAQARNLCELADRLPPDDPKLDQLVRIVTSAVEAPGPGKVLVFSYFLNTLSYLVGQLRARGIRVGLVTGQVPDEEREALRERFRLSRDREDALDVLLSSEVGCEGLDYEFCDRLVNYDIPWNPMRVEQRIGRIDRFGQTSEKVLIYNFITPGTVEERIYFRCFERLGVFRETIGDLEEVLGDVLDTLNQAALGADLTPQQAQEKAEQAADNALRLIEERRRVEEEGEGLLALEQSFVREVDDLVQEGRFVSAEDLEHLVTAFVSTPPLGGALSPVADRPDLRRLRLGAEPRAQVGQQVRALRAVDQVTIDFLRWLDGDDPHLVITFDQEAAVQHRSATFITPVHALARVAREHWVSRSQPLVTRLVVEHPDARPSEYAFLCELWETIGLRTDVRLVSFAREVESGAPARDIPGSLLALIGVAEDAPAALPQDTELVHQLVRDLEQDAHEARKAAVTELRARNERLVELRLASSDAYFLRRREAVQAELAEATDPRIHRMKRSELSRLEREHETQRSEVESRRNADIVQSTVAIGILTVESGEPDAG